MERGGVDDHQIVKLEKLLQHERTFAFLDVPEIDCDVVGVERVNDELEK